MSFCKTNLNENNTCIRGSVDDQIRKESQKKMEGNKYGYGYSKENGFDYACGVTKNKFVENAGLNIKVLGSGRKNCTTLLENVYSALEKMNYEANVIRITDYLRIIAYGIKCTPALMVNEKVVSCGKVLEPNEIIEILENEDRLLNKNYVCCCA